MAINPVDRGTAPDNGTGDDLRTGAGKINSNFTYLEQNKADKSQITALETDIAAKETPAGAQAKADAAEANANNYTDSLLQGRKWKDAADVATTQDEVLSGEKTVDGVLTNLSRVLVKNQTNKAENGIYISGTGAWTRTADADTGAELEAATLKVLGGTENLNKIFTCNSTSITLGNTDITFAIIGDGVDHNSTTGIQGGQPGEYYHLTQAEKDKLTGIEANAKADQTGAEIKQLYEAQPNTNALTDARRDKLDGIPASIEPAFTKNTAFNKDFGQTAGTVAEGNDQRIIEGAEAHAWGDHSQAGYASNTALSTKADKDLSNLTAAEAEAARVKINAASQSEVTGIEGRVTALETNYEDLAITWNAGDSKILNISDSTKVTAVYINGDRLVKDSEWTVFSATEIQITNTLNNDDIIVVERGRGGIVDEFKEGFYTLDIDGYNTKEKFVFYSKRPGTQDIYVGFNIVHQYDMSESVYADLWRIAGAGEFQYINGAMVDLGNAIMTSLESECVYNSGGDDFVGGFHGDEILSNVKFFADGVEIPNISTNIPLTPCKEFSYRQKSTMHQAMKAGVVDANHTVEAIHHKITTFKNASYTTFNRLIPQYNDAPIGLWYHGISCVGKVNGETVANDFLEYEPVLGDNLEKLHQVGGRKYFSSNNTNGTSAYIESRLLRPENKDKGCEMFIWDRAADTKYYRKFIPTDPIVAGDIWESEMTVRFDKI